MNEGIRSIIVVGEIIKEIKKVIAREIIYKNRDQFAPRSIKIPDAIIINNSIYDMTNCTETGMGLLAINSSTRGLFIDVRLAIIVKTPLTMINQEINVMDLGRLFIFIHYSYL